MKGSVLVLLAILGASKTIKNKCSNGEEIIKDVLEFDECKDCSEFGKGIHAKKFTSLAEETTECSDNDAIWKDDKVKKMVGSKPVDDFIAGDCEDRDLSGKCGPVHVIPFQKGNMILEYKHTTDVDTMCEGGMFLPFIPGEMMWGKTGHIIIYLLLLIFSFLGIAIIADVFMAAIEVITSKEKTVTITENGKPKTVTYLVWNATIANLTLMALGSSAPEILLSVIETLGTLQKTADPGGLGPGTIVGSRLSTSS